jgi:holo-[acyl-carrier protein] synthase
VIVATGVDIVDLRRIEKLLAAQGGRFVRRIYTEQEHAYCARKRAASASYAARFAAKEAVMKCLGTGWADGVGFLQIEVVREASGEVGVRLAGRAAEVAKARGIARIHLTLAHERTIAIAVAVAERE